VKLETDASLACDQLLAVTSYIYLIFTVHVYVSLFNRYCEINKRPGILECL